MLLAACEFVNRGERSCCEVKGCGVVYCEVCGRLQQDRERFPKSESKDHEKIGKNCLLTNNYLSLLVEAF